MKNFLMIALMIAGSAHAQDFCAQLGPLQASLQSCNDQLINSNGEVRRFSDISRENERMISSPRANQERAQRLNACSAQNAKLQEALASTAASVDEGRASVGILQGKSQELARFVRENLKSTYECVAIDPKFGNAPDHTGEPRVYFGAGRTQDEAKNALRTAAAQRGNTAWDRLKEAHRCFELLDRENAQRIDNDVKALGNDANSVRFGAARG